MQRMQSNNVEQLDTDTVIKGFNASQLGYLLYFILPKVFALLPSELEWCPIPNP